MSTYTLTADTVGSYLAAKDVLEDKLDPEVITLDGGVSNTVLRVSTADDCLVVKQPLANLAVEDDWPADTARVHNEAAAAEAYGSILAGADVENVRVPAVAFTDTTDHILAITCAPESTKMWKRHLLAGVVDPAVAESLGRFLGTAHVTAAENDDLRREFVNKEPFEQLRLDPYHRTVAERHPDIRQWVDSEIDRVSQTERTLVHGDFSPKNVLVDPSGAVPTVWLLDFEVAHWGDPAFDTAFMLNHLFIKSVYNIEQRAAYLDSAMRFWRAYTASVDWNIETDTVAELAVLMLARIDGKSPVEYVNDEETKEALRTIAKRVLQEDVRTLSEYVNVLEEVSGS